MASPYDPGELQPIESTITLVEVGHEYMHRDESLVQVGDKIWIVSTDGSEPELTDKIKLDGIEYQLINIKPLKPGPVAMLYTVHGRK